MPKIVRFHRTGGPEVLQLDDVPPAEPGPGEVRLKVEAIGLNRAECMFRQGHYLEAPQLPSRLGYEAAGVIEAIGPEVSGFKVGERVSTIPCFPIGRYGVYGEWAIVPAYALARYPETLTPVEGAAIWMQYLTAYGALILYGRLQRGHTLLITAATSSVGLAAIQIANREGAVPIAVTRKAGKKDFLFGAGAAHVIAMEEESLVDRVMALTNGTGVHMVFDPVAGPLLVQLAEASAQHGIIFEYGALSPDPTPFPLFPALAKGLTFRGYTLFEFVREPDTLEKAKAYIHEGLKKGTLKPVIDRIFLLSQIVEAHRYMESNQQKGKIVVTV
ncbi:MAG: NADPH:quinone reductase [Nitrospirae bacterium]|nr:MAG: NADPH:quinone reductase [Nitrospirota bacterium]